MSAAAKLAATAGAVKNLGVGLAIMAVLGGIVFLVLKRKDIATAVDPTSDQNVVNRGVHHLLGIDTEKESLGTMTYDAVDKVYDWLPFLESDAEKLARLDREAREQRAYRESLQLASQLYGYD